MLTPLNTSSNPAHMSLAHICHLFTDLPTYLWVESCNGGMPVLARVDVDETTGAHDEGEVTRLVAVQGEQTC